MFEQDYLNHISLPAKLYDKIERDVANLLSSLVGKTPIKSEVTQFGIKHTYKTEISGKDGKSVSANVVVVIQKDNGRITYKIVTVYPDKKGEKS